MSPAGPAEHRFRVATWNVNSLRARGEALGRFLDRACPDVLCLQETKATDLDTQAAATLERAGYQTAHVGRGGYNGVAIASRHAITRSEASGGIGDEHLDREPRLISCLIEIPVPLRLVSLYVPHGRKIGDPHFQYKLAFLDSLANHVTRWLRDGNLIVAGDVNVAATDSDIFHPDAFVGLTHVTPAERAAWKGVLDAGLVDVDVARWGPRARRFTWWNYGIGYSRNLGMRLDVIAADHALASTVDTSWIDHVERDTDRPSDHASLIADFDLTRLPRASNRVVPSTGAIQTESSAS
jgi:exodeoxyribonuclease III